MARKHSTKSTVKTGRAPAQARSGPKKKAAVALEEPGLELDEVDACMLMLPCMAHLSLTI